MRRVVFILILLLIIISLVPIRCLKPAVNLGVNRDDTPVTAVVGRWRGKTAYLGPIGSCQGIGSVQLIDVAAVVVLYI